MIRHYPAPALQPEIEAAVDALNARLGLTDAPHRDRATFGYIGNAGRFGDDRLWMVFLPHDGRIGGVDRIGHGFTTDNDAGAARTLALTNAYAV